MLETAGAESTLKGREREKERKRERKRERERERERFVHSNQPRERESVCVRGGEQSSQFENNYFAEM